MLEKLNFGPDAPTPVGRIERNNECLREMVDATIHLTSRLESKLNDLIGPRPVSGVNLDLGKTGKNSALLDRTDQLLSDLRASLEVLSHSIDEVTQL